MGFPLADDEVILENSLENNEQLKKIREEVLKKYKDYHKVMLLMATDAPLEIMCLPKPLENILLRNGFLRVYDLINVDFTKIKGLGVKRSRNLATSLDQFVSML